MATIAELLVKISGDSTGLRKELSASQRQLKRAFGPEAMGASKAIVGGFGIVAAALGGVGVAAVKMSADLQQSKIAFTTMLGSAAAAETMLSQLAAFAEKTPFEFTGLVESSKKLLAYGYSAQEIIPMLNSIGDAVAAVGGSAEVLDRVTLAFGQMRAKGFVSGEEMRQLAEAGIPAWQMLAKTIGKTIPEAMKLAEDKALNADAAIAGMLEQMSGKYGGMMVKQSNTVTGILSNIKDKGGALMRQLGDEIVDALDLQTKLKSALSFLDEFASKAKTSGIKEAFSEMLPPGLEIGLYAVAGALTFAMIPALENAAIAAAKFVIALGPIAWVGALVGIALSQLKEVAPEARSEMDKLALSTALMGDEFDKMADSANNAAGSLVNLSRAKLGLGANVGSPEEYFAGTGLPGGKKVFTDPLITGGGKSGPDPVKEAERVSEAIEREWAQTTKTELEQLDLWRTQQIEALDKTAEANENYERDKERVAATYSVRRQKILEQEAEKAREIGKTIRDAWQGIVYNSNGLTGNKKELIEIEKAHQDSVNSIGDKWDQLAEKYKTATESEKAVYLKNLQERGIAYQDLGNGQISFESQKLLELQKLNDQYYADLELRHKQCKDVQSDIDEAYRQNSMTKLQEALTAENAIRMNDYTAQQSMMQTYQEAFLAAHQTSAQLMANLYKGAFDSMSSSISDLITGAKTVGEAFAAMGQAMLKVVADYVAKWLASKLMMAVFGKSTMAAETAAGVAAGSAMAAAWAPAAAAVSLATFGANSAPAMAGIAATYGLTTGLAFLANGGLTTGPSLAVVGEGKYQEAVLPLSQGVFDKLGDGIAKSGGGQNVISPTFNIYANDGKSTEYWLKNGGGKMIRKYMSGLAANFEVVTP